MTKREKIAILKKMREILKEGVLTECFCNAYMYATGSDQSCYYIEKYALPKLGLKKPKKPHDSAFWYSRSNPAIRIKKIDQAIKKLQNK